MFYNKQKNSNSSNKKESIPFRERLIAAFKKNYTTSFFLLCMFIGWILDLSLNTMPKYTVTGMVAGAVIGSCFSVKKRNEEKEKKDPKNGKKLL